jgi:GrpB-like predicted nucleotidyltransferase (UPF0157 family)
VKPISVVDYDPAWPQAFARLRSRLLPAVHDIALAVEHLGSTSVPGLAAKPVIDIAIVVASNAEIPVLVARLAGLGYLHQGDLGVAEREAFASPDDDIMAHHVYGCPSGSLALQNHLAVREYLRAHSQAINEYGVRKERLAQQFPHDRVAYVDGKTGFILEILRRAKFPAAELAAIERANRRAV